MSLSEGTQINELQQKDHELETLGILDVCGISNGRQTTKKSCVCVQDSGDSPLTWKWGYWRHR